MTNSQTLAAAIRNGLALLGEAFVTDDVTIYYDGYLGTDSPDELETVKMQAAVAHDCVILTHLKIKHIVTVNNGLATIEIL